MAYTHQPRYRGSLDRSYSLDAALAAAAYSDDVEAVTTAAEPIASPLSPPRDSVLEKLPETPESRLSSDAMPPPPPPGETPARRTGLSATSAASRNANRLSLTLPIAQPNSISSRPTPTSSVPQTPVETPAAASPADPNEFIIAIAAQERRVLELREELKNAEGELSRLKTRFTASDSYRKRASARRPESLGPAASITPSQNNRKDRSSVQGNPDMDRRKAALLAQSQGSPREARRTIIQGGHARALSLLSPTKPANDVHVLADPDVLRSPEPYDESAFEPMPPILNKRATWAPRQAPEQPPGVKQMANDFRQGLWTFVEDLRQATVGEEGISGTSNRTTESAGRPGRTSSDQDTIRASATGRGRIPFPAESSSSASLAPGSASTSLSRSNSASFNDRLQHRRTASRPEPKARKHFSWTPLTLDQCNDDDWSNWDSPNVKTSRWSGSTVNGDIIPAIPEKADENEGALKSRRSRGELRSESSSPSSMLEDMPQALLNRLAPGNLKKSAGEFIKEWERSLSSPPDSPSLRAAAESSHIPDQAM